MGRKARSRPTALVGNSAPSSGSGLFIDEGRLGQIAGDLFHDNACDNGGPPSTSRRPGAVPRLVAKLENVTMTDTPACPAGIRGAAIFTEGGSDIAMTNSIVTDNGG